jgi:hypothetical protein
MCVEDYDLRRGVTHRAADSLLDRTLVELHGRGKVDPSCIYISGSLIHK